MVKAILVDDETHCIDTLEIVLKEYCPDVHILAKCTSANAALEAIRKQNPDIVFLDIEMPFMNGFEMLEQLDHITFATIFTTSYDQYAIKAIRFSALDYILKPVDPRELVSAVHKIQKQKQLPAAEQFEILFSRMQHKESVFRKMAVPTSDGFELIVAENILRCEADDNYTYIYLNDKKKITVCRSLKEVEEQLRDFFYFIRVHHSWIVNMNEVTKYVRGEGGYLIMTDGTTVNVSRSRKEALLKWF